MRYVKIAGHLVMVSTQPAAVVIKPSVCQWKVDRAHIQSWVLAGQGRERQCRGILQGGAYSCVAELSV